MCINLFFIDFLIICRKGSLNVDYEVYTAMNSQVVADMTFLSKDMVLGKSKVTYEGHEVTVSSVTLVDTSGNSRKMTFNILDINFQEKQNHKNCHVNLFVVSDDKKILLFTFGNAIYIF